MKTIMFTIKKDYLEDTVKQICSNFEVLSIPEGFNEVVYLGLKMLTSGWCVILTEFTSFCFPSRRWIRCCSLQYSNGKLYLDRNSLSIDDVGATLDIMVIRYTGSIESQLEELKRYIMFLKDNLPPRCKIINHPDTMIIGMRKDYYMDLQCFDFVIPTDYYDNSVSLDHIKKQYLLDFDKRLIKPVTGELGNSLKKLTEISDEWLRYKQPLVGGWLVQLVRDEIRNGEYQIFFIGNDISHSNKKIYSVEENEIPLNKDNSRRIEPYIPSSQEIKWAKKVCAVMVDMFKVKLDIYRVDYFIDNSNTPILLEFEMVNPGLFISYMDNDERRNSIINKFQNYCESLLL